MTLPIQSKLSTSPNPILAFRGEGRVDVPLHPLEKTLIFFASLHLCFLPWAIGGMNPWAQITAFFLSLPVIVVALLNRTYVGELTAEGPFRLVMWPRLLKTPVFWLGLAFLLYLLIGALNPAWKYMSNDRVWWLRQIEHLEWLPTSVRTSFEQYNAWRVLMIYTSIWFLACGLTLGLTRRIGVLAVFSLLIANGALLALLGVLQRVTGASGLFWSYDSPNASFISSFIYRNHAAAYFNLLALTALGLMAWHYLRGNRRHARSSPAPLYAFCAVGLSMVVFLSLSRAGAILLLGSLTLGFFGYVIWILRRGFQNIDYGVSALVVGIFLVFIYVGSHFLKLSDSIDRVHNLFERDWQETVVVRDTAAKATWELAAEQPLTGWGAGSFRHAFPRSQMNYPEIFQRQQGKRTMTFRWEFAHNDWAQGFAELGYVGMGLLAVLFGSFVFIFVRHGVFLNPPMLLVFVALCTTLLHAWVDFPAHNPAVLTTWCAVCVLLGRWAQLERQSYRRPDDAIPLRALPPTPLRPPASPSPST